MGTTSVEIEDWPARESALLTQRSDAVASGPQGGTPPSPAGGAMPQGRKRAALALSGGGIRSATFTLGVLQAVAEAQVKPDGQPPPPAPPVSPAPDAADAGAGNKFRASLLSRFDYLSTVSGGGYVGSFLASLFKPDRLRDQKQSKWKAADDATAALASGPPRRMRASQPFNGEDIVKAPMAWLRENGRYLVPTGSGDAVYAGALVVRNWVALHYVIGTLLMMVLAAVALLRAWAFGHGADYWEAALLDYAAAGGTWLERVWWSPFFGYSLLPLLVAALPLGFAYWLSYDSKDGRSSPFNLAVFGSLLICGGLYAAGVLDHPGPHTEFWRWIPMPEAVVQARQALWYGAACVMAIGLLAYIGSAATRPLTAGHRVLLTNGLATSLLAVGVMLAIAVVDTLGQTLYLAYASTQDIRPALTPAALVAGLVWITRKGAAWSRKPASSPLLSKVPLTTLAGIAGVVIFVLVAALWSFALNWLTWAGEKPDPAQLFNDGTLDFLCWFLSGAAILAVVTGQFPGFINLSSLQTFYAARIARAYLGASNGERFKPGEASSVGKSYAGDNLKLADFYDGAALSTLAPLHIINVTLNKTVDPAEQLVQRDRKGQPLAALPYGFSVDGTMNTYVAQDGRFKSENSRPLSLGQWIGTSGAAFSTGIGRETSLGMSLLMGSANVRLGTWWESGADSDRNHGKNLLGALFRTQAYLSYEFRAQFFGLRRKWQYLSDGGHFENTAMYELLRPARKVGFILACDCGADPEYRFDDLANLMRLVRIDSQIELSVVSDFGGATNLANIFGAPEDFRPATGKAAIGPTSSPCALLIRAAPAGATTAATWIVLVKPSVPRDAPADIVQYQGGHKSFPQEPTTDQFFDEAQWESYRSLGHLLGARVLTAAVFDELRTFCAAQPGGTGVDYGIPRLR